MGRYTMLVGVLVLLLCSCGGAPFSVVGAVGAADDAGQAAERSSGDDALGQVGPQWIDAGGGDALVPDAVAVGVGDQPDGEAGSDAVGASDARSEAGCPASALRCSAAQPETCVSGAWLDYGPACSGSTPVCLAGACVACSPDQAQCSSSAQPQTCSSAGTWQDGVVCPANQTCVAGACGGECGPGQMQCAGGNVQTCGAAGTWQVSDTCTGGLYCGTSLSSFKICCGELAGAASAPQFTCGV